MSEQNFPPKITTSDGSFIMSPKNDYAFRLLFGDEKNKEVTISFLSALLNIPVEDINIKDPSVLKQAFADKSRIFEIRMFLASGGQADVEVWLGNDPAIKERVVPSLYNMTFSQFFSGERSGSVKKSLSLVILDCNASQAEEMHTTYRLYDCENDIELSDSMEVHLFELPKLKSDGEQNKKSPEVLWLMFLNAATEEELRMAAEAEPKVAKAYDLLLEMSDDGENRRLYEESISP
ncbi:Conserved hypothetical protein CHP01784 [Methanoplanus limicola DSM 2279]|uniref:Uncharacterized protein n=2 Tax=Methanoplanus limicola TaxID=2315 RepID=H1Z0X4_9EURY|nr:Conserved hypothetical protein CHP01784 [Methanoplanus limicola DSM 2279]